MTTGVSAEDETAELSVFYEVEALGDDLSEYRVRMRGRCGDSAFEAEDRLWYTAGKLFAHLDGAKLWWPKGYGTQNLYDVEVVLTKGGAVVDTAKLRTGLRTVRLERTALTDTFFSGKFGFYVNGERVFILGTNFVPIDALHSRDRERRPRSARCWRRAAATPSDAGAAACTRTTISTTSATRRAFSSGRTS